MWEGLSLGAWTTGDMETSETLLAVCVCVGGSAEDLSQDPLGLHNQPMLPCPKSELLSPRLQTVKNQDPVPPGLSWPSLLSPNPLQGGLVFS